MHGSHRYKLKIAAGRYRTWLERANDLDCLTLIWAVYALQSGKEKQAAKYISYPKEAVVDHMVNEFSIYRWELETIVTSLLTTPKDRARQGHYRFTNLSRFETLGSLANTLREIENNEYAKTATIDNIWEEMYRTGQRQFAWQRGYNSEQMYRYAYVYGLGDCASFFEERYGISVSTFMSLSMLLFGLAMDRPWQAAPGIASLDLGQDQMEKTLAILSIEHGEARKRAVQINEDATERLRAPLRTAYMPSVLRQSPMIRNVGRITTYCAPLPPLIMHRATSGLFYDIKQGPNRLLTEANNRFEEYVRMIAKAYNPRWTALKGNRYGVNKATELDPPDCLVKDGEAITIVIECKATKLTFEAQVADDPTISAKQGVDQIAKGIFQLWRFFSHARRGVYSANVVAPNAYGIVLTMDSWMQMAKRLREATLAQARELAANDPQIEEQDMRTIVFASIQELNDTFAQINTDDFMTVLGHAVSEKYRDYGLPAVARECGVPLQRRRFPLDIADVLPWWDAIKDPSKRLRPSP